MKLTLIMVTSLDGRSTKWDLKGAYQFNSKEDQKHFDSTRDKYKLIIMGSSTYEGHKESMSHNKKRLRVILTSNPKKYIKEEIPGILEFTNESPRNLIKTLEKRGFKEGLLVGGAVTNTLFFKEKLVNEILHTIEPKILGAGNGVVGEEKVDINLRLISSKKINQKGALLLKYAVAYK